MVVCWINLSRKHTSRECAAQHRRQNATWLVNREALCMQGGYVFRFAEAIRIDDSNIIAADNIAGNTTRMQFQSEPGCAAESHVDLV